MPIYEYLCQACQHSFEDLQSFKAPAPKCPNCGSDRVAKKLSTFASVGNASAPCGPSAASCGMAGGDTGGGCGCCGGGHHHH